MQNNVFVRPVPIFSLYYVEYIVPDVIMKELREEITKMISSDFKSAKEQKNYLAGNIEKEYNITETCSLLNNFIEQVAPEYWEYYPNQLFKNKKHCISLTDKNEPAVWVNFQKKGEFNPIHAHTGDLSFVIFVSLPYTYEEECNHPSSKFSNEPLPGCFEFVYVNQFNGGIGKHPLFTDRSYENKMILFNSNLHHHVHPFQTSNDYRITVAGNINIQK